MIFIKAKPPRKLNNLFLQPTFILLNIFLLLGPLNTTAWGAFFCNGTPLGDRLNYRATLFEFHKSFNPQNVLVLFSRANSSCRLTSQINTQAESIDLLWKINAGSSKECWQEATQEERNQLLEKISYHSQSKEGTILILRIRELENFVTDIQAPFINITLNPPRKDSKFCTAHSIIQLGASHKNTLMQLNRIFAELETFFGIPTGKVNSLQFYGYDPKGNSLNIRYQHR